MQKFKDGGLEPYLKDSDTDLQDQILDKDAYGADSMDYPYVSEAELDNHYYHTPGLKDSLNHSIDLAYPDGGFLQ